ncbi:MAG: hypothetical protein IPJ30_11725 [Acidobacteria bacterium]|nr:hypothetical protein [Acidobacteriota bacterium]
MSISFIFTGQLCTTCQIVQFSYFYLIQRLDLIAFSEDKSTEPKSASRSRIRTIAFRKYPTFARISLATQGSLQSVPHRIAHPAIAEHSGWFLPQ